MYFHEATLLGRAAWTGQQDGPPLNIPDRIYGAAWTCDLCGHVIKDAE